jgi:hypothetical protein
MPLGANDAPNGAFVTLGLQKYSAPLFFLFHASKVFSSGEIVLFRFLTTPMTERRAVQHSWGYA